MPNDQEETDGPLGDPVADAAVGVPARERNPTPSEIAGQIRFALHDLSARNGHHVFEEICRRFAEARIASNLLPATGPVASAGDQGRDFETFASFLTDELGPHGAFLGRVSEGLVVFTCTLQQADVGGKIREDVRTVLRSGRRPVAIYAFCTGNVEVGRRHLLENEVDAEFGGRFEIIDLQALSDQLAAEDTFWIAEQYLALPASLAPPRPVDEPALPEWYLADRQKWRDRGEPRPFLADVLDLKDGLRQATRHAEARPDLPYWLGLARAATTNNAPRDVRQRARYEIVVATIQAQGDLRTADDDLYSFFEELDLAEDETARLWDAGVLLGFAMTAVTVGRSRATPQQARDWNDELRAAVRARLASNPTPTRRAELLDLLGYLAIQPDPLAIEVPEGPVVLVDVLEIVDEHGLLRDPPPGVAWPETIDRTEAMNAWSELAGLLADTPLYQVERLSRLLNLLTPLLIDEPGWRALADQTDAALARTRGAAAAASSARDRGLALRRSERLCDALHEMHSAKADWWSGDALRGSLLSMLLIADCYGQLRLPQAAKQYALAACGAAGSSGRDDVIDLIPAGLLLASEMDYLAGASFSALEFAEVGLMALHSYVDMDSEEASDQFKRTLSTIGLSLQGARAGVPRAVPYIERIAEKFGLRDEMDQVLSEVPPLSASEWLRRVDEQLLGRAYSDAGTQRILRFAGLGLDWTITASSRYAEARAGERLAAAAQILTVELAEDDLCLIPTQIRITVELATPDLAGDERAVALPSNEGREWLVRLSPWDAETSTDLEAHAIELLAVLSSIMLEASVLPTAAYFEAVERAFKRGLSHKLSSGRPYDELAEVVPEDMYVRTPRALVSPPAPPAKFKTRVHAELAWRDDPGPSYEQNEAEELIRSRYQRAPELSPLTLPRLQADPKFAKTVLELRNRGWRDWHILNSVVNAILNYRLEEAGLNTGAMLRDQEGARRAYELRQAPEKVGDPEVPIELFDEDALELHRKMVIPVLLDGWKLELHQSTPDMPGLDRFLAERYAYWADDVPHQDPFPKATELAGGAKAGD